MHRELRIFEQELTEARPVDDGAGRRLDGHDGCGARASVERHFTYVFTGAEEAQHDFASRRIAGEDLHPARQDDVQRIARVPFVDENRALGKTPDDAAGGNRSPRLLGKRRQNFAYDSGFFHAERCSLQCNASMRGAFCVQSASSPSWPGGDRVTLWTAISRIFVRPRSPCRRWRADREREMQPPRAAW